MENIPKAMRAAVLNKVGQALDIVSDYKTPVIEPHQILVKLELSGVDHSDVHLAHGDWANMATIPIITGHEGIGTITMIGEVAESMGRFRVGERVGIPWTNGVCGHCDCCLSGCDNLCPNLLPIGFGTNGTHAEYVAIDANCLTKIPVHLDSAQAATMLCAGVTAYKAVKQCGAYAGQWVAIFGAAGGLGHLAVQFAHHFGLKVCAIDKGRERLSEIESMGADVVVDANAAEHIIMRVRELCDKAGPQSAIVCAPDVGTYKDALAVLKPGGTCVAISLPAGELGLDIFELIMRGKKLIGSIVGTRLDLVETLRLARDGKVKCKIAERSLDEINDVFDELEGQSVTGRIVVRISD
jgi:propanol-preferring alcohol dehydrogenase